MKRFALACLLSIGAAALRAHGADATVGEDLFKWGEYDSLIRVLEPSTHGGGPAGLRTGSDSAARAKSFLFLGVAFFATGKHEMADQAFQSACKLDPEVKLDRFYVTEEIANHFQAIALDGIRRRHGAAPSAAVTATDGAEIPARGSQGTAANSKPALAKAGTGNSWLWWSLGVTATAIAGGGAYYFANRDGGTVEHITTIDLKK